MESRVRDGDSTKGYLKNNDWGVVSQLLPAVGDAVQSHKFREIDPSCPDYSAIVKWITLCSQEHHKCLPIISDGLRSTRLIDVESKEVVAYPIFGNVEYVALSYVWGDTQPGSFRIGKFIKPLPKTIADAITVTHRLGRKYLWVDYVCIDQSDSKHKIQQISLMNQIYSGAWLTLVSLDGTSATEGLPRVKPKIISNTQATLRLEHGNKLSPKLPSLQSCRQKSLWQSRGWTFQEDLLSNRLLFFTKHQVYFGCNEMICSESTHNPESINIKDTRLPEAENLTSINAFTAFLVGRVPKTSWEMYTSVVNEFVQRKLSLDADIPHAILGVLNRFEQTYFPAGFIHGLPCAHLSHALLWLPEANMALAKSEFEQISRVALFPSWSWQGWRWKSPVKWLEGTTKHHNTWCGKFLPPIKFWTADGTRIIPQKADCHGTSVSVKYAQQVDAMVLDFSAAIQHIRYFDLIPIDTKIAPNDNVLTIQGMIIELEVVLRPDERPAHLSDDQNSLKYTSCHKLEHFKEHQDLASLQIVDWCFDDNVQTILQTGVPKSLKCLVVAMDFQANQQLPANEMEASTRQEPELIIRFSLLLLQSENRFTTRVGVMVVTIENSELLDLKKLKIKMERFMLI